MPINNIFQYIKAIFKLAFKYSYIPPRIKKYIDGGGIYFRANKDKRKS